MFRTYKPLILAVSLFLAAASAHATVTFQKLAENAQTLNNNSVTTNNFTSTVGTGNLMVVWVWYNSSTLSVSSVTDTAGNTYALAVGPTTGSGAMANFRQEIWYAKNIVGVATFNVTATFNATANVEKAISAHEYSGADLTAPLDVTAAVVGSTANASSGTATTTVANELIFGAALFQGSGTAGSNFTQRSSQVGNATEDKNVTSTGSNAATFTNTAQNWIAQMATFKSAGQSGGTVPSITSLSPTSGAVGASVTITGTNFGGTQGTSTVSFNGTAATPTSWSATSIVATVPTGATTGNVVVTVSGAASNGVSFTVLPTPSISSLSPTSGAVGASVTITGTGFGATQGSSTVKFNGTAATVTSWSATSIVAAVPSGATTGNVVVHASGVDSNGTNLAVVPAPSITSLSPNSGAVGTTVTVTGTGFGATQGSSTVKFNGTAATVTSWSATSIVATVPITATTGNVIVHASGVDSNAVTFTVLVVSCAPGD